MIVMKKNNKRQLTIRNLTAMKRMIVAGLFVMWAHCVFGGQLQVVRELNFYDKISPRYG